MSARTLDTRQLRHIIELDRYRNFHRAAESLCISQPALTKSIKSLEASLGVLLFDRDHGGISPTPFCEVILEHARRILLEIDEMNVRLDAMSQLRGGELRIGSGPIMAESVLADAIRVMLGDSPEIRIEVIVDDWLNLPRLLRQGHLHLFVADIAHLRDQPDLEVISLGRVPNILVCRVAHPLAARRMVTPKDFLRFTLALPKITDRLSSWLVAHTPDGTDPQDYSLAIHRIECQSVSLLRRLVEESDCITGGPRRLFERELRDGSLVELDLPGCDALFSEPSICSLRGRTLPPAASRLIDIVGRRGAGTTMPRAAGRASTGSIVEGTLGA